MRFFFSTFLRIPFLIFFFPRLSDTNRTRLVRKAKPIDSFFNFFTPPTRPDDEEEDSEEDLDLEERINVDYTIGEDLKEKVLASFFYFLPLQIN